MGLIWKNRIKIFDHFIYFVRLSVLLLILTPVPKLFPNTYSRVISVIPLLENNEKIWIVWNIWAIILLLEGPYYIFIVYMFFFIKNVGEVVRKKRTSFVVENSLILLYVNVFFSTEFYLASNGDIGGAIFYFLTPYSFVSIFAYFGKLTDLKETDNGVDNRSLMSFSIISVIYFFNMLFKIKRKKIKNEDIEPLDITENSILMEVLEFDCDFTDSIV
jgi:hypothetical protein